MHYGYEFFQAISALLTDFIQYYQQLPLMGRDQPCHTRCRVPIYNSMGQRSFFVFTQFFTNGKENN